MHNTDNAKNVVVGVVGLGLMGSSIVVAFLIAGHRVVAIAPVPDEMNDEIWQRILKQLAHAKHTGQLTNPLDAYKKQLTISKDYSLLNNCKLVMECVTENIEIKKTVYHKIASAVCKHTIIATNTSAIPISILQKWVLHPQRFLGIHWAEPAYMTRFLEVACGEQTDVTYAEGVVKMSVLWGKEPTLLKKDIRGFITNRLMYAVYREGLALIENGDATMEDVDKAFRYDAGSWITLMGIFRRLDFLGLQDSKEILSSIYPKLCNKETVPPVMQQMVDMQARGIHNLKGLFKYTPEEAKQWENAFAEFNEDIFRLAAKYPSPVIT
jgi:3-hydroxybutyryl-CoA dehydrogenase